MTWLNYFLPVCFLVAISCLPDRLMKYVCSPCDLPCDTMTFNKPGVCPHCHMDLIPLEELEKLKAILLDSITLKIGSGEFRVAGREDHRDDVISVFYKLPKIFNESSPVPLAIPGAGRNGDSYRDAWIEESEKYRVIVLSLVSFIIF